MTTAAAGARSEAPTVKIAPTVKENPHKEVYERCYETKEYRRFSPGEKEIPKFWEVADPLPTQSVTDWGCGTGRASLVLKNRGLKVTMVDFISTSRDQMVVDAEGDDLKFIEADLTKPLPEDFPKSHFGLCVDVLEHLPPEDIDQALDNILSHSRHVYFQIAMTKDHFGKHAHIKGDSEEGVPLHLTVEPYSFWLKKLAEKNAVVHMSKDNNLHCVFYVTAYKALYFDPALGTLNVEKDKLIENVRAAAATGLPQVEPMETQDSEIILLAGGPSLGDYEDEIKQLRAADHRPFEDGGYKLVTVNGTYQWAMDRGLEPSLQVIIDAREFNERFTEQRELSKNTKYLICSAADPAVYKNLPKDRTFIFHTTLEEETMKVVEEEFPNAFPVPGGCTVTLRAIAVLRMLGFYKFHIYGLDSCIMDGEHHAYSQPENDDDLDRAFEVTVAEGTEIEKSFMVAPWMAFQALDFRNAVGRLWNDCLMDVKGDGLIAYMLKAAAELSDAPVTIPDEKPGAILYALQPLDDIKAKGQVQGTGVVWE